MRARIILAAAEGTPNRVIARELGMSRPTVLQWRARFAEGASSLSRATRHGLGVRA